MWFNLKYVDISINIAYIGTLNSPEMVFEVALEIILQTSLSVSPEQKLLKILKIQATFDFFYFD